MKNSNERNSKSKNVEDVIKNLSNTKKVVGNHLPNKKERKVNDKHLPRTQSSIRELISRQNVLMRDQYSKNIASTMKFQRWARIGLTFFFLVYLAIITYFVFKIVSNPANYSDTLKITLLTTFFLNIFGVVYFIVRYVFQPLDDFMREFRNMDSNRKKNNNDE